MADHGTHPSQEPEPRGQPELIVVARPDAALQVTPQGVASATGAQVSDLQAVLEEEAIALAPLFGQTASEATASLDPGAAGEADLSLYYHVPGVGEDRLEAVANRLNASGAVAGAYVKPPAEPAQLLVEQESIQAVIPTTTAAPAVTPNFTSRQGYLGSAPVGIDAPYAWTLPGGRGDQVRVIDCEWGWNFGHEDLQQHSLGLVSGVNAASTNHGTAVHGEIGGDENTFGVTGISPNSPFGASSFQGKPTATAIRDAADALSAGDIILLEIHRQGPNGGAGGQQGYIAVEWWPDDFAAIRYAVNKGIIVVEAAGNGWENLDDAAYDIPGLGFPATWKNPFRLTNPSSGAVVVGAGNPPTGTHGRTHSPPNWNEPYVDRARCGFSNWGARIDAQGWGWEVTTTGYGDLQNGTNRKYTDRFSGTSSASPIVVGALACTQGVIKAKSMPLLTSQRARQLLRSTGSPQQAAPNRPVSQRIGNRPNLRQLIPAALKTWITNTTIRFTYTLYTSQAAWAYVTGLGWRRIKTGSPDGVSNVFRVCCHAQAKGGKVNVYVDDTFLYNIVQL